MSGKFKLKIIRKPLIFIIVTILCISTSAFLPTTLADCPDDCPDGMISYWKLNETVAGPVVDCYGSNDGTNNGATIGVAGQVGTAYNFDGTDDYIDCGDISELNSASAFTVSGWFRDTNIGGHNRHFDKGDGDKNDISGATYSNKLYIEVGNGANTYAYWNDYSSTISAGVWYHAAFVFNGIGATNADKTKIYVNGVERSLSFAGTMPSTTADLSGYNFSISKSSLTGDPWDGNIDEVALYNRVLTASEIACHYHRGLAKYGYCENMSCISFVQPLCGVDGDTSMWSTGDGMVVLPGTGHWELLGGTADVDGYINGDPGTLTHRGTRGLGINGCENDEVDGKDRPERIEITFNKPRALLFLEIRSLFDNEGPSGAPEEGDIDLYLDGSFIGNCHLFGLQPSGTVGRVNITLPPSTYVDKIVFYVQQGQSFTPYSEFAVAKVCLGPEESAEPNVDVVKEVWDEESCTWETEVRVPIGTDLLFRIIVTNNGSTDLTNVSVVDGLSYQLEYRNAANINPDFESLRKIIWNFSLLSIGEQKEITYHAETVHICYGCNLVTVTASEPVCDDAIVLVKVNETGQAVADVTMQVWDEGNSQWTDSINQDIGASLLFKITVNNTALHNLHNFIITDTFPPQLVYSNDASYPPSGVSTDTVTWEIDEMTPGEIIEITYHAETVWTGVGDTSVSLITDEQYNDEDSVLIIVFNAAPEANVHGPYEGIAGIPILFKGSASSGTAPYSWYWDFGNSVYSSQQNPDYRYRQPGTYSVSLKVIDNIGRTNKDYTYIVVHPYDAVLADAGGPYKSMVDEAIQFYGNAIGGITPYSWFWDFGDGRASWDQNPALPYGYETPGEHTVTLTVTDAHGKTDDDTVKVIVTGDNAPPIMQITKPVKALYINNQKVINFPIALILGNIDIEVSATDQQGGTGMNKVEFYVDGSLKHTATSTPYTWTWNEKTLGKKTITINAYDSAGNSATSTLDAWILNI